MTDGFSLVPTQWQTGTNHHALLNWPSLEEIERRTTMTDGPSLESHMALAQQLLTEIEGGKKEPDEPSGSACPETTMHITPSGQCGYFQPPDTPLDLTTFAHWIVLQPLSTHAGLLDVIANNLYRRGLPVTAGELKRVSGNLVPVMKGMERP